MWGVTLGAAWIRGVASTGVPGAGCHHLHPAVRCQPSCCPAVGCQPSSSPVTRRQGPTAGLTVTHARVSGTVRGRVSGRPRTPRGCPCGTPPTSLPAPGPWPALSPARACAACLSALKSGEFLEKASRGWLAEPSCKSNCFITLAADVLKPVSLPPRRRSSPTLQACGLLTFSPLQPQFFLPWSPPNPFRSTRDR